MKDKIGSFVKKETVLCCAAGLAAASMIPVPPDKGYWDYMNWRVLGLLFCLMAAVAGLGKAGIFRALAAALTKVTRSCRALVLLLTGVCFVLSALVTNDVALITFVPFTVGLLGRDNRDRLIRAVVLETVAANLGSLATPMGNPQNLLLYDYYHLGAGEFFAFSLPVAGVCLAVCAVLGMAVTKKGETIAPCPGEKIELAGTVRSGFLFLLSLLTVLGVLDWRICLGVTAAVMLLCDRSLFGKIDWGLLATFAAFFIFVGNLARMDVVVDAIETLLDGRVMTASAIVSQCVSNVPAAAMLCAFTENWRQLFLGVNLGGLGTPIASMASLISLRIYGSDSAAPKGRYLGLFSAVNFGLLILLLAAAKILWPA